MRPRDLQKLWLVPLLAVASLGAAGSDSSPVAQAVQNRDDARVRALLDQRADVNVPTADGTTALHWAVHWNDSETADLLIRAGANVNMANRYGATPLWLASERGYADVVGTLLKAGVDPNTLALGEGESPLMAAARAGSVETVELLLAHGADVNVKDAWRGQTALIMAAGNHEPNAEVVRVLLEHGADVHVRSAGGLTALLFAVRQHDVESVRLLLKAGANVNEEAPGVQEISRTGYQMTAGRVSALRMAINHNYYELAALLLDSGADPNAADSAGFTPLHAVLQKRAGGNPERGNRGGGGSGEGAIELPLKGLLAHGADPNARLPLKRIPTDPTRGYPPVNNVQYAGTTPLWIAANSADLGGDGPPFRRRWRSADSVDREHNRPDGGCGTGTPQLGSDLPFGRPEEGQRGGGDRSHQAVAGVGPRRERGQRQRSDGAARRGRSRRPSRYSILGGSRRPPRPEG